MDTENIIEIINQAIDKLDNTLVIDPPRWAQEGDRSWKQN